MLTRLYTTFQTSRSSQFLVLSLVVAMVAMAMVGGRFNPFQGA